MKPEKLFACVVIAFTMFAAGMPAQAGMVATSQLQKTADLAEFGNSANQRAWIETQLLRGGVAPPEASARVAAMTDVEIAQIYQRIDETPAGGSAGIIVLALIIFLVLEVTGYIDVIPDK